MTDRDLFYCTDFQCDGHARSNERCLSIEEAITFCDRVIGQTHTASDHDACERRRIEYLRGLAEPKPAESTPPKYTVSGNAISITRLDADGNPTGEPINLSGAFSQVAFGLPSDLEVDDFRVDWPTETVSMDIELGSVDPAILALLTRQSNPSVPLDVWIKRLPWWRRKIGSLAAWWINRREGWTR